MKISKLSKAFVCFLATVLLLSHVMILTSLAASGYIYNVDTVPGEDIPYPENGQRYWVIFNEGYRSNRLEMSTFDVSGGSDIRVVWNRSLKVSVNGGSSSRCNQYAYRDGQFEYIGNYGILSDYASKVLASNVDIYDSKGNLLVKASPWAGSGGPGYAKKGIIVLPGIIGSELYGFAGGVGYNRIWLDVSTILDSIPFLKCDEYGRSDESSHITAPIPAADAEWFGTGGIYTNLVKDLQYTYDSRFGGNGAYEVSFFAYDWRLTNTEAAKKLNKYIEQCGYSEVVLVAHSMGGIVSSLYISMYGDSKVQKLITLGTPYYGAPKALNALENGRFLDLNPFLEFLVQDLDNSVISELGRTMPGVYELLPSKHYFDNGNYYVAHYPSGFGSFRSICGYDYQKTEEIIAGRDWYNRYLYEQTGRLYETLQPAYDLIQKKKVDIYAIVGYNTKTLTCLYTEETLFGNVFIFDLDINKNGDGTVPLISSTMNHAIPKERLYYVNKVNHTELAQDGKVLQLIKNIINGNGDTDCGENDSSSYNYNCEGAVTRGDLFDETKLKPYSGKKIKAACPIEMSVYDADGQFIDTISPSGCETDEEHAFDFYYCGENDEIMIVFVDSDASITIRGTGEGTMDFSVDSIVDGEVADSVRYEDVPITEDLVLQTDTEIRCDTVLTDENGEAVRKPNEITKIHHAESAWSFDEVGHWHTCSDCDQRMDEAVHIGGRANCVSSAVCEICGHAYGALSENHNESDWIIDSDEKKHTECVDCHVILRVEVIPVSETVPSEEVGTEYVTMENETKFETESDSVPEVDRVTEQNTETGPGNTEAVSLGSSEQTDNGKHSHDTESGCGGCSSVYGFGGVILLCCISASVLGVRRKQKH